MSNPAGELLKQVVEFIRGTTLDSESKLLFIELASRMNEERLKELLNFLEAEKIKAQHDNQQLTVSLKNVRKMYEDRFIHLQDQIEREMSTIEGEISKEEAKGKTEEIRKKINES